MVSVFGHEAFWLSVGNHSKKEKAGKERKEDHSPLGLPPLATNHCWYSGWRECSFTVDIRAHDGSLR